MKKNANVTLAIDCSGSMSSDGLIGIAKTACQTFIYNMEKGDSVGVVSFNDVARDLFVDSEGKVVPIVGENTKEEAAASLVSLKPSGRTNLNDALLRADKQLRQAPDLRGIVLTTDGVANEGETNPDRMPASPLYPVHCISLDGSNENVSLLKRLAARSGGSYHHGGAGSIFEAYHEIATAFHVAVLLQSKAEFIGGHGLNLIRISAHVPRGSTAARFVLNWSERRVKYAGDKIPKEQQISLSIQDPDNRILKPEHQVSGTGFAIVYIPSPAPGEYTMSAVISSDKKVAVTCGIMARNPNMAVDAKVSPEQIHAGDPLQISAMVKDGEQAVHDADVSIVVESPQMSWEDAVSMHSDELDRFGETLTDQHGGESPSDAVKMMGLQLELGPDKVLYPTEMRAVAAEGHDGLYSAEHPTLVPGPHVIHIVAKGVSGHSDRSFTLKRRLSVYVHPNRSVV